MAIQADNIADLVTTTLKDLGRAKWTDISLGSQKYVAMPQLLREERIEFGSGYGLQWNVQVQNAGSARNVGLWETDSLNAADGMTTASVPWRNTTASWIMERREVAMNRDPARIVDLALVRRHMCMNDLAVILESNFWTKPTDSTDTIKPFGVPYWVVKNTSTGFNGTNPSGFTSGAGGISSSTYANWANYTAQYTLVTKDDLVRKWRAAAAKTGFESPNPHPNYERGAARYGYYMPYSVLASLEELLEAQNQNLGNDVASKDGQTLFRRVPCTWVPYLDSDTTNPVYGLCWSVFGFGVLSGEYMREQTMAPLSNQHTVAATHMDITYNIKCDDRRQNFVLSLTT